MYKRQLDLSTVNGFKIAAVAETIAYKILRVVAAKKTNQGTGNSLKQAPSNHNPPLKRRKLPVKPFLLYNNKIKTYNKFPLHS